MHKRLSYLTVWVKSAGGGDGNRRAEHTAKLCVPFRAHYLCYRMQKDWVVDVGSKVPD